MIRPGSSLPAALLVAALALADLRATSLVPPLHLGELARMSSQVALGEALGSWTLRRGKLIYTRTAFRVLEGLGGAAAPGEVLEVEAPGGEADGEAWYVPGSPRFEAGRTYLLFLAVGRDGVWAPRMLSHGLLVEVEGKQGRPLLVPLEESERSGSLPRPDGLVPEPSGAWRRDDLLLHLLEVLEAGEEWDPGRARALAEEVPGTAGGGAVPAGCAFLSDEAVAFRWRVFDTGGSATIRADATGDRSIAGGGFRQAAAAANLWHSISGVSLNLLFGGPQPLAINCTEGVQNGTIVFNDPCNDLQGLQNCTGVLAFGGPFGAGTHVFDGATWFTTTNWFVVVNAGAGCVGLSDYTLMLAHELGHGLGFAHVDDPRALMFASCCQPMNATDQTCARYAYPAVDPQNARPQVDAGSDLALSLARNHLRLSGTATDDGRPVGRTLTARWNMLSGPGSVAFSDQDKFSTEVSFSESGAYLFGLTANDGQLLNTDVVEVTVELWAGDRGRATFEERLNGYTGTVDTYLREAAPLADNSRSVDLSVDGDDPAGSNLKAQALLWFDSLFGPGASQVPPGSAILSATLDLATLNPGAGAALHRMTGPWSDRDGWTAFGGNGVQPGTEAAVQADVATTGATGGVQVDVRGSLEAWSREPCENFGWAFLPQGTDGWDFSSSEGTTPPRLTVEYSLGREEALVTLQEPWLYFKGVSDPTAGWNDLGFTVDASWLTGATPLGYGTTGVTTTLADMRTRYLTVYCRKEFTVANASRLGRLLLRIDYDDGFVAYLNGEEAARSPSLGKRGSAVTRTTRAELRGAGKREVYLLDHNLLETGTNVLAVEVHNGSLDSSDLFFAPELVAGHHLLDEGAEWRFLRGRGAIPTDWRSEGFDDSRWEVGPVGIGYGDGDDATVLGDMFMSYQVVFCRGTFQVPDPRPFEDVLLSVIHDDGVVVYLNGEDLGRANMPPGAAGAATPALINTEPQVASFRIPRARLKTGRNVLAASVHNFSIDSSDLSFIPVLMPLAGPAGEVSCGETFIRGDATGEGLLDVSDPIRTLGYLFLGGEAPACLDSADFEDNGRLDVSDAIQVLNHLFQGGPAPASPGTTCGPDPTPDPLGDCSSPSCRG